MDCIRWQEMLDEYIDGLLSAEDAQAFEAHAATCHECAELLAAYRLASDLLGELPEQELPSGFAEDLHARLLAVNEQTKRPQAAKVEDISRWKKMIRNQKFPRAAAALLVCAWGLGAWFYMGGGVGSDSVSMEAAFDTAASAPAVVATAPESPSAGADYEYMMDDVAPAPKASTEEKSNNSAAAPQAPTGAGGSTIAPMEQAAVDGENVPDKNFGEVNKKTLSTVILVIALALFAVWMIIKAKAKRSE